MGIFDLFKSAPPAKSTTACECDICSKNMDLSEGYLLTTKDVITKSEYWEYAFTHQWSYVHDLYKKNPNSSNNTLFLVNILINQANQETPWSLCEDCSKLFTFDKKSAKGYALKNISPPKTGHADMEGAVAGAIAMRDAWKKLYNEELPDLSREIMKQ